MFANARSSLQKAVLTLAMILVVLAGSLAWLTVTAPEAEAASASCSGGRCTVWLTKAETAALGNGKIPAVSGLGRLSLPFKALVVVHQWIAKQYASRGWCSGFTISIWPWDQQGYFGYRC